MTIDRHTPLDALPTLLRVEECAAWLDVSAGTVREEIRRGRLSGVRLGRLVRVPRVALAAMVGRDEVGS